MRHISKQTAEKLNKSGRMHVCCLAGAHKITVCSGRIEWHHNLIYGGKQSDIPETILPLCQWHHRYADQSDIKEQLDWIMLSQMSDEQIRSISKAIDYAYRKEKLDKKFRRR